MSGSIQDLDGWTVMRLTQPPAGLVPGLLLPVIPATRLGKVISTGPSRQTNITVADRKALPGACRTMQRSRRLAEGADEGAAHPLRIAKAVDCTRMIQAIFLVALPDRRLPMPSTIACERACKASLVRQCDVRNWHISDISQCPT